jgi:hypothetical protein
MTTKARVTVRAVGAHGSGWAGGWVARAFQAGARHIRKSPHHEVGANHPILLKYFNVAIRFGIFLGFSLTLTNVASYCLRCVALFAE